ncbi:MAG: hypothetical protein C5B51_32600 [Terriglobia bacterium]|nr:MAG: hypothetical protein C5B51_32600 [Terriglobia bacterium]
MQGNKATNRNKITCPALGTTYEGGDVQLLEHVLPLVDFVEVTPDSMAEYQQERPVLPDHAIGELKDIGSDAHVIVHGVGLSIGTHDGYSETYLQIVDKLLDHVAVEWHSEHLGYVNVDGQHLGTMLAVSKTGQVLDILCERIKTIQQRYGIPFLIENIVHILPDFDGEFSDAAFLNALANRTGCGLILDVYNLECDAHNHGFDIPRFLAELEMEHVREIHLAGGVIDRGFRLDVHSRITDDSTIALARQVIAAAPNLRTVTYELLPEAVPKLGYRAIAGELKRLRQALMN